MKPYAFALIEFVSSDKQITAETLFAVEPHARVRVTRATGEAREFLRAVFVRVLSMDALARRKSNAHI